MSFSPLDHLGFPDMELSTSTWKGMLVPSRPALDHSTPAERGVRSSGILLMDRAATVIPFEQQCGGRSPNPGRGDLKSELYFTVRPSTPSKSHFPGSTWL